MSVKSSFYNEYDIEDNEKHVLWAQCSFQNHHQTFHDRCPEKIGPLPKKIGPLVHPDMSRKNGTGPNLIYGWITRAEGPSSARMEVML